MMTQKVYQDKLLGKVPEDLCLETLGQFRAEEAELTEKVKSLTATLEQDSKARDDIEEFICRLKQYADAPELTREHPAVFRSITNSSIMGLPTAKSPN